MLNRGGIALCVTAWPWWLVDVGCWLFQVPGHALGSVGVPMCQPMGLQQLCCQPVPHDAAGWPQQQGAASPWCLGAQQQQQRFLARYPNNASSQVRTACWPSGSTVLLKCIWSICLAELQAVKFYSMLSADTTSGSDAFANDSRLIRIPLAMV